MTDNQNPGARPDGVREIARLLSVLVARSAAYSGTPEEARQREYHHKRRFGVSVAQDYLRFQREAAALADGEQPRG